MTLTTRPVQRNGSTPSGSSRVAAPAPPAPPSPVTASRAPQSRRSGGRRNTGRVAAGVVLVALSALGAVTLFSSAADRTAVIGVARDVTPGAVVTEADLREVSVSAGSGLRMVPADDAAHVVGRVAVTGLTAGSLLNPDQLADGPTLPDGSVLVGAVLKGGQFPVGLSVGDRVEIVETAAADASGTGEPVSRGSGTVTAMSDSSDGQSLRTVSLAVPVEHATAVSAAGAAGRLSLVVTRP